VGRAGDGGHHHRLWSRGPSRCGLRGADQGGHDAAPACARATPAVPAHRAARPLRRCRGSSPGRRLTVRKEVRTVEATTRTELWALGAAELAAAIRERRTSSREGTEARLARIDSVNKQLNAVTVVLAERARLAADEADRRLAAGESLGARHGVPLTARGNADLAGSSTTWPVAPAT